MYTTTTDSPVGRLTLASDGRALCGLWLEGQKYFGGTVGAQLEEKHDLQVFAAAREWLADYFAGGQPAISRLPLAPAGGEFRQAVWEILCEIPYGGLVTYGDIAKKMAARLGRSTMSSQAVGGAVGHNPVSIIIPCHRVVGANGSLTGYAGGVDAKIWLLQHEGVSMEGLFRPAKGTAL